MLQPIDSYPDCQQDYINACYINVGCVLHIDQPIVLYVLCFVYVIRDMQMNISLLLVKVHENLVFVGTTN